MIRICDYLLVYSDGGEISTTWLYIYIYIHCDTAYIVSRMTWKPVNWQDITEVDFRMNWSGLNGVKAFRGPRGNCTNSDKVPRVMSFEFVWGWSLKMELERCVLQTSLAHSYYHSLRLAAWGYTLPASITQVCGMYSQIEMLGFEILLNRLFTQILQPC